VENDALRQLPKMLVFSGIIGDNFQFFRWENGNAEPGVVTTPVTV
jgi:hypothetical protein